MRSKTQRIKKYEAKTSGDVSKNRLDRYGPMQKKLFNTSVQGQVAIENTVKSILNSYGVSPIFNHHYMNFAKKLFSCAITERDKTYNKYYGMGLRHDVLRYIGDTINDARLNTYTTGKKTGPVGYWAMSKGSGNTAYDYSGYNNTGNIIGAVWDTGVIGSCLHFDGIDDSVNCGDTPSYDIPNNLSVSLWAKNDDATPSDFEPMISKYNANINAREFSFNMHSNKKLRLSLGDPITGMTKGTWESVNVIPNIDGWNHYAFVFASGVITLFLNGKPISGVAISGTIPSTIYNGTANLQIGKLDSGVRFWDGMVDEVKIWNRLLTADEIQKMYHAERPDRV